MYSSSLFMQLYSSSPFTLFLHTNGNALYMYDDHNGYIS